MRSINLISKQVIRLEDWYAWLSKKFNRVWLEHCDALAKGEGHLPGTLNSLSIEDKAHHIFVCDRPTTIREYEPAEIEALREVVGEPAQFFAMDYRDEHSFAG